MTRSGIELMPVLHTMSPLRDFNFKFRAKSTNEVVHNIVNKCHIGSGGKTDGLQTPVWVVRRVHANVNRKSASLLWCVIYCLFTGISDKSLVLGLIFWLLIVELRLDKVPTGFLQSVYDGGVTLYCSRFKYMHATVSSNTQNVKLVFRVCV